MTEHTTHEGRWQGYNANGLTASRVRELFIARHGYCPDTVILAGPVFLAGPLRENEPVQPLVRGELVQLSF